MGVITVSRQMGSLGTAVAGAVAERLGYRLVCRELIDQAGRRAGAPEAALAAIDELGLLRLSPGFAACRAYRAAMAQVAEELAAGGNVVLVGRACQVILRGRPDTLHVRLIAPAPLRAERIALRHGVSPAAARSQVQASDRYRRRYLQRFYNARWDDPELYDLILNTGRLSAETASDLICSAAATRFSAIAAGTP